MTEKAKKRLVFCFDGTWNRLDAPYPTNVVLTAQSVLPHARDGDVQVVYYDEGVGTAKGEKWRGGIFGAGLLKNLGDAYRSLLFNYTPGDEIYIFGFSRGAFSARSFAGLISTVGIIGRKDAAEVNNAIALYRRRSDNQTFAEEASKFRATYCGETCVSDDDEAWRLKNVEGYNPGSSPQLRIHYLGVWDTVGALGIPQSIMWLQSTRKKYQFHNTKLSRFVRNARHAVSIDERRVDFQPTLWEGIDALNIERGFAKDAEDAPYQQRWFPGTHGGAGGGGDRRGLSDAALEWIWDGARHVGLELDLRPGSRVFTLQPDHTDYVENVSPSGKFDLLGLFMGPFAKTADRDGPSELFEVTQSARRKWKDDPKRLKDGVEYRPGALAAMAGQLDALDPVVLGLGSDESGEYDLHEIMSGDTLSKLALRYYGSAKLWPTIFDANKYKISDPDKVYVGQVIRIPKAV